MTLFVEVRKKDGEPISGVFLGLEGMTLPYETLSFKVEKGEMVLLFTDCLFEAMGAVNDDEIYGYNRIVERFLNAPADSPAGSDRLYNGRF